MTLVSRRLAYVALTTSALAILMPATQGEARPLHSHHRSVTFATPSGGDVTDFSARRRVRHYGHHVAYRKWHHSGRRHYARRVRPAAQTAAVTFPFFGPFAASQETSVSSQRTQRTAVYRTHRLRPDAPAPISFGGGGVVAEARRYIGTNPTGRARLWCATFMNMVLERSGHRGTGSNLAWSFARYGQRVSGPQVGAIAVMGHHVGVVSGIDSRGNPILISGNYQRRVAEAVYPRGRIAAYVMPM
jgi:uncharacterized protein (TIGR02594 family)